MRRVIVVGGGYAGTALARALDAAFDVTLLERRDRFYHNVGAMRAYAAPEFYRKLLIPYDRLLRRGRVEQEEAVAVRPGQVECASGRRLEAGIVVVATGSGHVMPFKSKAADSQGFLMEAEAMSASLATAGRVTILGDGPVAVELAGEVSWRYPEKRLTLQGRNPGLLGGAGNPRLGERIVKLLEGRGVEVKLGRREAPEGADLVIPAFGMEAGAKVLGAPTRVPVDGHFRVPGMENVYAIGDAADCGEPALAFLATRQAAYLAKFLQGRTAAPYGLSRWIPMAVPLGPKLGAMTLPVPGLPVVGSCLTSWIKGRDLFVKQNWERMGQPTLP